MIIGVANMSHTEHSSQKGEATLGVVIAVVDIGLIVNRLHSRYVRRAFKLVIRLILLQASYIMPL